MIFGQIKNSNSFGGRAKYLEPMATPAVALFMSTKVSPGFGTIWGQRGTPFGPVPSMKEPAKRWGRL